VKLAVMQPYFFPYIGYFALIARTDRFVVFDICQYTKKSWLTRNRILHPEKDWQYINVPVKKGKRIMDTEVIGDSDRTVRQLQHYRGAPYFDEVIDIVRAAWPAEKLTDLCVRGLENVCRYVGIRFDYSICSELKFDLPDTHPGGWALEISDRLDADEYVNLPGGKELFRPQEFAERGIRLSFIDPPECRYDCGHFEWHPRLSILDVLMWNSPEEVRQCVS